MRAIVALAVLTGLSGALLTVGQAAAKGPFRAEISGGGLAAPVVVDGPLPVELVFENDAVEAEPPAEAEPAYTVKLMPEQPDGETGEYPVLMTLTYFPGDGETVAVLRGDWGGRDRYFEASEWFQAVLDEAIGSAAPDDGDGLGTAYYVVPGLAAFGLVLIGGLAGLKGRARLRR